MRLSILLIIVLITYSVTKYVKTDVANTVSIVVTVVGIVISCVDIVKNVFNNREELKNPPDFRGIFHYEDCGINDRFISESGCSKTE